ncbi:MAG: VOC family protein [Desulfobacterales bacterium]|nr:VOC family protein [Desulfobacterales bacterium]
MKVNRIEHIAIAVTNLGQMRAVFENKLGLELGYTESLERGNTKIAMYPVGESHIELLEGTSPEALTSKWISRNGPGLFHICLEVDSVEDAIEECRSNGLELLRDGPRAGHAGTKVAFIDPAGTGNVLIELVEAPKPGQSNTETIHEKT